MRWYPSSGALVVVVEPMAQTLFMVYVAASRRIFEQLPKLHEDISYIASSSFGTTKA
jgi:hypothetical protein